MRPNGISTEFGHDQPTASQQVFGTVQPRPATKSGQVVRAGARAAGALADGNYVLSMGE